MADCLDQVDQEADQYGVVLIVKCCQEPQSESGQRHPLVLDPGLHMNRDKQLSGAQAGIHWSLLFIASVTGCFKILP